MEIDRGTQCHGLVGISGRGVTDLHVNNGNLPGARYWDEMFSYMAPHPHMMVQQDNVGRAVPE